MDGPADELADELHELTRRLRDQLLRHAALGAWAAPGGATARNELAGEAADEAIEREPDEPGMTREAAADEETTNRAEPARATPPEPLRAAATGAPPALDVRAASVESAPIPLGRRSLIEIRTELGDCTRCKLSATRRSIVYGVGAPDAQLMFVGEAPGEQEDRRGEPFVGPAGQLLDKMIEAMGWTRDTVYIANTTKCRPPNNRNPQPDELDQCMPFLHQQIASIAPRIIVALGRPASNQLLERDVPITALRGKFHDYPKSMDRHSLKIMPTFHPAYLLRDPDKKRIAWADLKMVIVELERLGITPPKPHA